MRVDDVPPGWLVVAVESVGQLYCLGCRTPADGEPLCEDEIATRSQRQKDVICVLCGCVLSPAL